MPPGGYDQGMIADSTVKPVVATRTIRQGKQTKYTESLGKRLCACIAAGMSLRRTCKRLGIRHSAAVRWYMNGMQPFTDHYARAREIMLELQADEIIDIADSVKDCTDNAIVTAARNRIDARKWILSKMKPDRYGDRIDVTQRVQVDITSDSARRQIVQTLTAAGLEAMLPPAWRTVSDQLALPQRVVADVPALPVDGGVGGPEVADGAG